MEIPNNKNYEVFTAACNYVAAGLEVIYDHPIKKNPIIRNWQTRVFTLDELKEKILIRAWHVGIRNIEGLDFDNNGNPDADELLQDWKNLVNAEYPGLVDRLLIEKTRNGGFHIVWKCEIIEGSQKLALRPPTEEEKASNPKQKVFTLIETRGRGGQFVVSPSLGYTLIQGDWCKLSEISPQERLILLQCARVFDRMPKIESDSESKQPYTGEKRPGDVYAESEEGITESFNLLIEAGWTIAYQKDDVIYLSRPGKDVNNGISATFGYVARGVFYNFSSNAAPFEPNHVYSPFQIYAFLKHGGVFSQAARELAKRPGIEEHLPKEKESWEGKFRLTDWGNAEKIAYHFGNTLRYDHKRERWLIWHEPRWRLDADGEIYRLAKLSAKNRFIEAASIEDTALKEAVAKWAISSENKNRIEAACSLAKNILPIADPGDKWDQHRMVLSCPNGIIDLMTGFLRAGKPEDLITMSTGVNYNPHAVCPRWEKFINEIFENNIDLINYVQKALGYSLTGDMREQVVFIGYGQGANGKSVLHTTLMNVLGDYAHNTPFSTFQSQQNRSSTNDLSDLEFRRFVVSNEALGGKRLDEVVLKSISGGDPLSARQLYDPFATFQPHCKIWFFVNHKPIVKDDSYGFWRRVRLIPFLHTFEKEKQDEQLSQKLLLEAEGILAWLIKGTLLWQKEGLVPVPEIITDATTAYQRDSDTLADYINEICVVSEDVKEKASKLWNAYDQWANEQGYNSKERLGSKGFYSRIAEKFKKAPQNDAKYYEGICLKTSFSDGSTSKSEASAGSGSENTNPPSSSSYEATLSNEGSHVSPVTLNGNEVVEDFDIPEEIGT